MSLPINTAVQLNLWEWLEEAAQVVAQLPELVMMQDGIKIIDAAMDDLENVSLSLQLAIAAQAIEQLTEPYQQKANELLSTWGQDASSLGTVLSPGWTSGLVRQPVDFDLSAVMQTAPVEKAPRTSKRRKANPDDSVAAPISKESALAFLNVVAEEDLPLQAQLAALAGNESPAQWQVAISHQLDGQMTFSQLRQRTGLAPVELWLGLLLGGFQLSRLPPKDHADPAIAFYSGDLWVDLPVVDSDRGTA